MYLGKTYLRRHMPEEAVASLRRAVEQAPGLTLAVGTLGYGLAVTGRAEEARKLLGELEDLSRLRYVSAMDMAVIHVGLGENDRALERLEQAFVDYSAFFALFSVDAVYEGLRSEPRFRELLRRAVQAS
jgi:serine/threonine-protein kinase